MKPRHEAEPRSTISVHPLRPETEYGPPSLPSNCCQGQVPAVKHWCRGLVNGLLRPVLGERGWAYNHEQ